MRSQQSIVQVSAKAYDMTTALLQTCSVSFCLFTTGTASHASWSVALTYCLVLSQNLLQQVGLMKPSKMQFCILDDFSGTLRPGRITLLLGPPGAGKSTLLNALAGRLQKTVMHVGRLCTSASWDCSKLPTPACIVLFSDQTHLAHTRTQAAIFSWL